MTIKYKKSLLAALGVAVMAAPIAAQATNGYFAHGYGIKAKGMAGAGIAFSQDTIAAATNPAGMVHQGNRMDVGAEIFMPDREAKTAWGTFYSGPSAAVTTWDGNGDDAFLVPEFGYNKMINKNMAFGVSVFGNGGMNTRYNGPIYSQTLTPTNTPFTITGTGANSGVDLMQLFISPTVSFKMDENNSFGMSLNVVYQRFKAYGIAAFCGFTPTRTPTGGTGCNDQNLGLSDVGYDDSYGVGFRFGWQGKLTKNLTAGFTYQPKTNMKAFSKYDQLFANKGDFDIPSNYGIGLAYKPNSKMTIALDYMVIKYSDVPSISNPNNGWTSLAQLGDPNGPGFGWDDVEVTKLGVNWQYNNSLVLRAGWNHGTNPIDPSQTQFNVLAPGVVEDHLTLGFTKTLNNGAELSGYYMHAFENEVKGTSTTLAGAQNAGHGDIKMSQHAFGVAYGWKF